MMEKNAKIYVAGHRGMVGSAILRELQRQGYTNIITRTHKELDLTRQDAVEDFFAQEKPEYVFLAAAKVGGIVANQEALADFMYDNMTLEMNVIHSAWKNGCKKLEFLGSSCIYESMVQRVYRQIKKVDTDATVTIVTSKTQVSAIHNQLGEEVGISVEPCCRDTFPAIALATAYLVDVMHIDPSESVVVCPVDP